jgi:PAS domain S-box-containing protein
MKEKQDPPVDAAELRRLAEDRLKVREQTQDSGLRTPQSEPRLVHELQVHQIELEMQNEELQQARNTADALLAQYTDLYDFAPAGYLTLDREGAIRQANLTGALLLGVERSRLVNRRFGLFVTESDRRAFSDFLARVFASEAGVDCEVTLPREGPPPLVVRIEGRRSEDGQECRAVMLDVTERKRMEAALREHEEMVSAIVESSKDCIWVIDRNGRHTYSNLAVESILGYSPAEFQSLGLDLLHPEDKPLVEAEWPGWVEERRGWRNKVLRWRAKDGAYRHLESTAVPICDPRGELLGFRGVDRDITERRQAEDQMCAAQSEMRRMLALSEQSRRALLSTLEDQKQAQILRDRLLRQQITLNRITLALGALTEVPAVLRALHSEVQTLLDASTFFVSRYHKDSQLITALFVVDEGVERDASTFPPVPLAPSGKGMQSHVLRTTKPLNVPNLTDREHKMQTVHHLAPDGTFTPLPPETERDDCTKSALLVPLLFRDEPIGVLQVQSNRLNAYSQEDEDFLAGLGNVAAISIQNALLIEEAEDAADELRLSIEGTLHAVSAAAETRDPYTAGHQRRVTDLALAIACELGGSDDECNTLRIAGTVHDIGKLGIPAEILSKPGTLAPIELALIREHPQTAYDILADVPFPGPVAEIVLQHHERLDGSGYPRALAGDQILREARILAVADVVEAMASHRPYREARGIDAALGEIEQNAGLLYDSEAVEACLHLFRDKGYALPA